MKKAITLITIIAIVVSFISLIADIHLWNVKQQNFSYSINLHLRFLRIVLFAIVVLLGCLLYKQSKSNQLLTFAFANAVIADYFLIYENKLLLGIVFFVFMQLLLIKRHFSVESLFAISFSKNIKPIIVGLIVFFCVISFLFTYIPNHKLLLPIIIYAALLILSCITAWYSTYNKIFTSIQSQYIFIAMLLFFLCDLTVLMPIVYPETKIAMFARAVTGFFYAPCLLLLTLSTHIKNE